MRNLRAVPDKRASFEELYKFHYPMVVRLCRLLLSDPQEAEDVGQEVFLKMFRQYQSGNKPSAWGAWITRVTTNACRDRRRSGWWKHWRAANEEFQEANHASHGWTPEEEALREEGRARIWRSFRQMSGRQQEVFVLRHVEGWSTEEVAETLGLTVGSVKSHLWRAVHHLRKALRSRS